MNTIPTDSDVSVALFSHKRIDLLEQILYQQIAKAHTALDLFTGDSMVTRHQSPIQLATYEVIRRALENNLTLDSTPLTPEQDAWIRVAFENLIPDVETFLDQEITGTVSIRYSPDHAYFNYNAWQNAVVYGQRAGRLPARTALAHELSHHAVELCLPQSTGDHSAFFEGHAIGTENHFPELLNPEAAAIVAIVRLQDLFGLYSSILCSEEPDTTLTRLNDSFKIVFQRPYASRYGIGHALFAIAELKHGPSIYAEALRDPRVVLQ